MPPPPPPLPNVNSARQHAPPPVPKDEAHREQWWLIAGLVGSSLLTALLLLLVLLLARERSSTPGSDGAEGANSQSVSLGTGAAESASEKSGASETKEESASEHGRDPAEVEPTASGAAEPAVADAKSPAEENVPVAAEEPSAAEPLNEEFPRTRVIPIFQAPANPPVTSGQAITSEGKNPFLSGENEKSIVFVIDKSSSMANGNLARVAEALIEAIDRLNSSQSFQVIFFDDTARFHPSLNGLNVASAQNKRLVVDWIRQVSPGGGTRPLEAMLVALQGKPSRIILLSDGDFDPSNVDDITERNRKLGKLKVRIDCIGLNEVVVSLQSIAKQNGPGIYFQAR